MWGLEIIEEPVEWGVLLNVAYTCRTHINMDLANKVREQFERALCPDDGHSRFRASPAIASLHRLDEPIPSPSGDHK
jgi:hypothetical protein